MNDPLFIPIPNINTHKGDIPTGYSLVVYEKDTDPNKGFDLYGFDEIGLYREFGIKNPQFGFVLT